MLEQLLAQNAQPQFVIDKDLAEALQPGHQAQIAGAEIFELLWPKMYGRSSKKQQPLQKVDYYMLEETQELIRRLKGFCAALNINANTEFKIARRGNALEVIGDFEHKDALNQLVDRDTWFVDSFLWLQPNYANLAYSFEVLEYSEHYEQSPQAAADRFAHLNREDRGLAFALKHTNGVANAQVETPLNLYRIEG